MALLARLIKYQGELRNRVPVGATSCTANNTFKSSCERASERNASLATGNISAGDFSVARWLRDASGF